MTVQSRVSAPAAKDVSFATRRASVRWVSPWQWESALAVFAIVAAVVLGVVLYGLSSPNRSEQTPPSPSAQSAHPQGGGQPGPASPSGPRANESGTKG